MNIQITGKIIGLKEDLEKEEKSIKKQVDYALLNVGAEMQSELKQFIETGVYDKYSPREYLRRSADPSYGRPLTDDDNFDIGVKRQTLEFLYEPTGEHKKNPAWHDIDNDELIEWLQHEHEIGGSYIPPRPFWNDFIDKQADGGFMEKFIREMSPKYKIITDETDETAMNYLAVENYISQD